MAALKACQKKLGKYRIADARFVATEACRRAGNGQVFLDRVRAETGLSIDIISSEEEAQLAFLGCSSLLTEDFEARHRIRYRRRQHRDDVDRHRTTSKSMRIISDWLSIGFGVMNLGR